MKIDLREIIISECKLSKNNGRELSMQTIALRNNLSKSKSVLFATTLNALVDLHCIDNVDELEIVNDLFTKFESCEDFIERTGLNKYVWIYSRVLTKRVRLEQIQRICDVLEIDLVEFLNVKYNKAALEGSRSTIKKKKKKKTEMETIQRILEMFGNTVLSRDQFKRLGDEIISFGYSIRFVKVDSAQVYIVEKDVEQC